MRYLIAVAHPDDEVPGGGRPAKIKTTFGSHVSEIQNVGGKRLSIVDYRSGFHSC